MSRLAIWAVCIGAIAVIVRGAAAIWPAQARRALLAFPRNRMAGAILAALDLLAVGAILYRTPLGWFEPWKWSLAILCPAAIVVVVAFADELLAPRALGGLLLILAAPLLDAARWHGSDARLVMSVLAYAWVVAGVAFVVSPWLFRKMAAYWTADERRLRFWSVIGAAAGLGLILLGMLAY